LIRPIRENLAFTFEFSPIIDRVIEGLRPAHARTIQGVDYLDAIEHATICMRLPRGLFVSIGLMVVYSSSLRSQRRFEAAASELESRLGQRHQPRLGLWHCCQCSEIYSRFRRAGSTGRE